MLSCRQECVAMQACTLACRHVCWHAAACAVVRHRIFSRQVHLNFSYPKGYLTCPIFDDKKGRLCVVFIRKLRKILGLWCSG